MRAVNAAAQLMLKPRGSRLAATRQGPHHDPVRRVEVGQNGARGVPQSSGHPVSIDRTTNGFGDDQTDVRFGA
jgi:hypothetical protein